MSVFLPPDRLIAICKQRWQAFVLCCLVEMAVLGWFFQQQAVRPHGHAAPATLVAMGLALALLALSDWIWRCPACKHRLPRGMLAPPPFCPQCAVPLSNPAELPLVRSKPAKQVIYGCLGLIVLMSLARSVRAPRRHHGIAGGPTGSAATMITAPTPADQEERRRQIDAVDELLARRWPGDRLRGTKADLVLLQRLLDRGSLRPSQTYALQCVGTAFGTVLANEIGLHWVVAADTYGRDPALQYENSSLILFPLTMISKRVEKGESVDLKRLFHALQAAVRQHGREADPAPRSI